MRIKLKKPKDKVLSGKISFRCTKETEEKWRLFKEEFEFSDAFRETTEQLIRQCEGKINKK